MKKLFLTIAAAVGFCFVSIAQDTGTTSPQQVSLNPLNTNGTTFFQTLSNSVFLDASRQRNLGVEFDVFGGTATSNQTFYLVPTIQSTGRWDSNQVKVITVTELGAGLHATILTNLDSFGFAGWYVAAQSNNSPSQVTTNTITYLVKTKAP